MKWLEFEIQSLNFVNNVNDWLSFRRSNGYTISNFQEEEFIFTSYEYKIAGFSFSELKNAGFTTLYHFL